MGNPTFMPVPGRCLIDQAFLWVESWSYRPIEDHHYINGGPKPIATSTTARRNLVLALSAEEMTSRGLFNASDAVQELVDIPALHWIYDNVAWPENMTHREDGPPLLELKSPDGVGYFSSITVSTEELFRVFPGACRAYAEPCSDTAAEFRPTGRARDPRGRPPVYDEKEFYSAVAVLANFDGLPSKQSEALEILEAWCMSKWGYAPGETWLKEHLSPVYRALREGRNFVLAEG
jgi:hypothetical protein